LQSDLRTKPFSKLYFIHTGLFKIYKECVQQTTIERRKKFRKISHRFQSTAQSPNLVSPFLKSSHLQPS